MSLDKYVGSEKKYISHYSKTDLEMMGIENVHRLERKAIWAIHDAVRGIIIKEIRLVVVVSKNPHDASADLLASYAVKYGKKSISVDLIIKQVMDKEDKPDYEFVLKSVNLS